MEQYLFNGIPDSFLNKWQEIADLLASIVGVPAALIMKADNEFMEVYVSSKTENNPYHVGDKEKWYGLYCETVIKTQKKLLIPNALEDENWNKNPDLKLGMNAYLGFPINYPDNRPFGTICVLDNVENSFLPAHENLILHFKNAIEQDLALIEAFEIQTNDLSRTIREQHLKLLTNNSKLIAAKEKAEESEEKLKSIFRVAPAGIGVVQNRIFTEVNPKVCEMTGYRAEELLGQSARILYPTQEDYEFVGQEKYRQIAKDGTGTVETRWQRKDNKIINILLSSTPVETGDLSKRVIFTALDISDRIMAEQEVIAAKEKAEESDRLKSAFLANMSHEIRTPMNGILGFANLLKKPDLDSESERRKEYIGIIQKSGVRMLNIINDIISISKIEAGLMNLDVKKTNIHKQIEYIYTFFKPEAEKRGISLSFKNTLAEDLTIIKTDREKVYAILTNLVNNAIKYTEKGSIELGCHLNTDSKADRLELYVKDTGIGIPEERQKAIFERFIQADIADEKAQQGAGLGLAITKAYVEMLGGKIWVESEEGKGSEFYFTLPYTTRP
ncbi:MAG: PAS domain S-box protein [Bacteroidales bacterium]|nr:PAS domain S-box protein [Bacteroidales bacterium]